MSAVAQGRVLAALILAGIALLGAVGYGLARLFDRHASLSMRLAARYLRNTKPRSWMLYLIPVVPLFQFGLIRLMTWYIRRQDPLAVHHAGSAIPLLYTYCGTLALVCVVTYWYWWQHWFSTERALSRWGVLDWLLWVLKVLACLIMTVLAGPFGIVTLIVWAGAGKPSSRALTVALPLSYLLQFGVGWALFAVSAHEPLLRAFHAEWSRALGNAQWILAMSAVLSFVFVLLIRRLSIFTTISTYGMFLGSAALVIVLSVMSGFEGDIKGKILGTHAHVVVTRPEDPFTDWEERVPKVAKTPGVVAVTPYLSGEAMVSSPANRSNVVVHGIDPASINAVTDLGGKVELGKLDSLVHPEQILSDDLRLGQDAPLFGPGETVAPTAPKDKEQAVERVRRSPPGILVGRELAKSLRIYLGDDVSLVSPTGGVGPSGVVPKARPYRVAGIFYTGMFEYDSKFVYVTLPAAQKLFDQAGEVTGLEIKVNDPDHTEAVVAALGSQLGPGYEVADWKSLNRSLFSALALEKIVMFVFLSFIILVAAFSIVANGQMIATRKTAEIAILKSMGATGPTIASAFLWIGAVLGGLGVAAGVLGGLAGALALERWGYAMDPDVFYLTQLPVRIERHEIIAVGLAGILITVVATLYPAWLASRMTPVEGLREGGR